MDPVCESGLQIVGKRKSKQLIRRRAERRIRTRWTYQVTRLSLSLSIFLLLRKTVFPDLTRCSHFYYSQSMTIASTLRQLLSFDDETARCTPVTVKDGPSFCIQGPVCGSKPLKGQAKGSGLCPRRNDKADGECDSKAQHLSSSCTALVDAKCIDLSGDNWKCVFPIDGPGNQTVEQSAPYTQDQIPSSPMSDQAVKLSAPALESHTTSNTLGASNASINIAVGVACCVLAFVGLVFVKKRRNRERSSSYTLSEKDISIVTL